jgi:HK97 family phage major capsid protein
MEAMKKFEDLLTDALGKFSEQGASLDELKTAVEHIERTVTLMKSRQDELAINRESNRPGFSDAETAGKFCEFAHAALTKDMNAAVIKDLNEGTDEDGGFLVPEEFRPTLIRLVEVFGVARQWATIIPMARHEMVFPRLTGNVQVFWINEGKPINQVQPKFGELRLVAKKLAALVPVTGELLEDSTIAIANLLATLFAEQIAAEEDRVAFRGDAVGLGDPFTGVLNQPGVVQVPLGAGDTSFNDVDADDLADATAALRSSAQSGARWWMHRTVWNIIRKIKTVDGEYIVQMPTGPMPAMLWGFPLTLVEQMPGITEDASDTPFIIFGNLSHLYIGDRRRMTMAQSQHVGFTSDKIFLRVIQREAIQVAIPDAFAVIRTAA